jgi:hypothetical protein
MMGEGRNWSSDGVLLTSSVDQGEKAGKRWCRGESCKMIPTKIECFVGISCSPQKWLLQAFKRLRLWAGPGTYSTLRSLAAFVLRHSLAILI